MDPPVGKNLFQKVWDGHVVQQLDSRNSRLRHFESANDILEEQLKDHNNTVNELDNALAEIATLKHLSVETVPNLEAEVAELKDQLLSTQQAVQRLEEENAELQKKLARADEHIAKLECSGARTEWVPRFYQKLGEPPVDPLKKPGDEKVEELLAKQASNYW